MTRLSSLLGYGLASETIEPYVMLESNSTKAYRATYVATQAATWGAGYGF